MSSWGLGWKRSSDTFHLTLSYGADVDTLEDPSPRSSRPATSASPASGLGFRINLDWIAGDDEDQTALKVQSQVMVALPSPEDMVQVEMRERRGISGNVGGQNYIIGNIGGQNHIIGNLGDQSDIIGNLGGGSEIFLNLGGVGGISGNIVRRSEINGSLGVGRGIGVGVGDESEMNGILAGGRGISGNIGNVGGGMMERDESGVSGSVGVKSDNIGSLSVGSGISGSVEGKSGDIRNIEGQIANIGNLGNELKERGGSVISGNIEGETENLENLGGELKQKGGSVISGSMEGKSEDIGNVRDELNERGEGAIRRSGEGENEDFGNVGEADGNNDVKVQLKGRGEILNSGTIEGGWEDVGNVDREGGGSERMGDVVVEVEMRVVKRREPLRGVILWKEGTSGQQIDGMGVLLKLMRSNVCNEGKATNAGGGGAAGVLEGVTTSWAEHWQSVTVVSLCGLGLAVSDSCSMVKIMCLRNAISFVVSMVYLYSCSLCSQLVGNSRIIF